ncbi:MAG: hypothetical protein OXH75_27490 [Acidobacteria bacterium]|nr:hypothetical protein [Acidobacteriota bacterium]
MAVTESEKRIRADIKAVNDRLDQQEHVSRRRFVETSALGVVGIASGLIGPRASNQPPPAQDVDFSVKSRHGVRAGGEPAITPPFLLSDGAPFLLAAGKPFLLG